MKNELQSNSVFNAQKKNADATFAKSNGTKGNTENSLFCIYFHNFLLNLIERKELNEHKIKIAD